MDLLLIISALSSIILFVYLLIALLKPELFP